MVGQLHRWLVLLAVFANKMQVHFRCLPMDLQVQWSLCWLMVHLTLDIHHLHWHQNILLLQYHQLPVQATQRT